MHKNRVIRFYSEAMCFIVLFLMTGFVTAATSFIDDFGDVPAGSTSIEAAPDVRNANGIPDFWRVIYASNRPRPSMLYDTTIEELVGIAADDGSMRGVLSIETNDQTLGGAGLLSAPSEDFNFFNKKLRFTLEGIELDNVDLNAAFMRFAITAGAYNSSRFVVSLNGNRGVQVWTTTPSLLGKKQPLAAIKYEMLEVPSKIEIEIDATSYRVVFEFDVVIPNEGLIVEGSAVGGLLFSGEHRLTVEDWVLFNDQVPTGMSAIMITGKTSAGNYITTFKVDQVSVEEVEM